MIHPTLRVYGPRWVTHFQSVRNTNIISKRTFGQPAAQTHPHLLSEDDVTPGLSKENYRTRRYKLMNAIAERQEMHKWPCDSHIVVIPSAAVKYMTHDIPYVFRQNTDFLYLSGFQEPDSVLILEANTGNLPEHKATLFVREKDPKKELWEGERSGIEGSIELTGVDSAESIASLGKYLNNFLSRNKQSRIWYSYTKPTHVQIHLQHLSGFFKQCKLTDVKSPEPLIQELRLVKSPEEIRLMQNSNDIASAAFKETMKFSHPGVDEAHIWAKMDFECRVNGAEYLAYPPVVAGGNRANTIHYIKNDRIVPEGHMVLMDAGCEYHGYASDITRTWPVSGYFTEPQRELYETLLGVQEACIEMCSRHDISLDMMFRDMLVLLGAQMRNIGVIPRSTEGSDLTMAARQLCPHHLGHYLGMDVHDTGGIPVSRTLQPGTVVTIEPGVYIPETKTDVPEWFRGIGIRIEDDILITDNGYHNLTTCPKSVEDIENLMSKS